MRILCLISHSLQLELVPDETKCLQADQGTHGLTSLGMNNTHPASSRLRITDSEVAALYHGETGAELSKDSWFIKVWLTEAARGRRVFATESGVLGLASKDVMAGDQVAILHRSGTPVVLRAFDSMKGYHDFMGCCYLEDAMFGEAMTWEEKDAQVFKLK
jgi:hypothetical protein